MATSVYGIAKSVDQASEIVDKLKGVSFSDSDISVLMADKSGTHDFAVKNSTKAPEGAVAGAGLGGMVGAAAGLLAGIGLLTIPGVGPFIAAGPIMSALTGAGIGAAVGGLTGALVGLGIPEYEARRYEGKILGGGVLISVLAVDGEEVRLIEKIFDEYGVEDVHSALEAAADVKATNSRNTSVTGKRP